MRRRLIGTVMAALVVGLGSSVLRSAEPRDEVPGDGETCNDQFCNASTECVTLTKYNCNGGRMVIWNGVEVCGGAATVGDPCCLNAWKC